MRQRSPRLTVAERQYCSTVLAGSELLYRLIQIVFGIVGQPHNWGQRPPSSNEEQRRKRRGPKNGAQRTVWSLLTGALQSGGRLVSHGTRTPSWKEHVKPNERLLTVRKPTTVGTPPQGGSRAGSGFSTPHFHDPIRLRVVPGALEGVSGP